MPAFAPNNTDPTLMARRSGSLIPERYLALHDDDLETPEFGPRRSRGQKPRAHTSKGRFRRWRYLIVIPLLAFFLFVWSFLGALSAPGNQSLTAKWADWFRAHHMAFVINPLEAAYYSHTAPAKGGAPKALNAIPKTVPVTASNAAPKIVALPKPTNVPLVVSPALPGEGQWQPVGPSVDGQPAMYEAQFRADTVYTSEITTAVWMDPKLLNLSLVPGLTEPGGTWSHPPYVTPAELPNTIAAFNGGFRFQDANGGFYLDGKTAVPLHSGAASLVFYKNGSVNVGAWGSEVTMTPNVVSVLQNLVPMVDNGQVAASATYNDTTVWGATLGASVVVARSGVGVTANGALVYVAGPALTARTLAESLQRAGAVRAMTLDINPEWVTFNFFNHPNPANPSQVQPQKLYPQMQRPATRYLGPTKESRDFITVSLP